MAIKPETYPPLMLNCEAETLLAVVRALQAGLDCRIAYDPDPCAMAQRAVAEQRRCLMEAWTLLNSLEGLKWELLQQGQEAPR